MSLKRMAMKMALAYAATKGYEAFRGQGGMSGLQRRIGSGGTSAQGGGLAGMLGGLMSGSSAQGGSGGLGSMLGGLSGNRGGTTGASAGGLGGLLGGLAAMAGGTGMAGRDQAAQMAQVEEGPQDEATAAAMIRAIGQAVRADGEVDEEERAALREVLGDAETEQDRRAVEDALREPLDPEGLAGEVPIGSEAQVYAAALTAIDPDQPTERAFLARFAKALRLDGQTVRQLHEAAGKPT